MSKQPTAEDKRRFAAMADYGCVICRQPASIHHIRSGMGLGQRNHRLSIPLCPEHHQHGPTAYHRNRIDFEREHGTELELLAIMDEILAKG